MHLLPSHPASPDLRDAVLAHRAADGGREVALQGHVYWLDDETARAACALGLAVGDAEPKQRLRPLRLPRIALHCGPAVGYPYYAYYAHALLSLGLTYRPVTARQIAEGALSECDLLIMPGGFATWGLDRAEACEGADGAIRLFLDEGGAYIGSCGGAFYASQGRPGWFGAVDAKPKYTHEYLQTGAGIVNIAVDDEELGHGLPGTIEVPYYHGPVYAHPPQTARALAVFQDFALPSRLFIDNPLDRARFESEMKGTPAVLRGANERAIVFSPHPEMGDFVRKAIALDGYVRHYLPIRGEKVMDETLRFYATEDCAGFRLILNAMRALGLFESSRTAPPPTPVTIEGEDALPALLDRTVKTLEAAAAAAASMAASEDEGMRRLVDLELQRLLSQWTDADARLKAHLGAGRVKAELSEALHHAFVDAVVASTQASGSALAQQIILIELPVRLAAAAARLLDYDAALEKAA